MPDPAEIPVAKDPGLLVSVTEIQDYAHQVDGVIRAINVRVGQHEAAQPGKPLPLWVWVKWVKFRLDWEKTYEPLKIPGWFTGFSPIEKIRGFHLEALRWRDRWAEEGVSFVGVTLLQPGAYDPSVDIGVAWGFAGLVGLGALGVYFLTRSR